MDLSLFNELMVRRYGEAALNVFVSDENATCKRCATTGKPYCVTLDTSDQPHGAAAFCPQ